MYWIDKLSRKIGESRAKKIIAMEENLPDIKQELSELDVLRERLIKTEQELEKTRLEWDRTFDSIIDNIVLIDRDKKITKANNAFYNCVEKDIGHVEFIGMNWKDFKEIDKIPMDICLVDKCFETGIHQEASIEFRGKTWDVSVNPVYTKTQFGREIIGVVRVARDITCQEKVKRTLQRRSTIYHAISEMSKTLVTHEDWNNAVHCILGDLGRAIGASRVYIFENVIQEDRICSLKRYAYHSTKGRGCATGDITSCINYDLLPNWQSRMEHGLSVEGNIVECNLCPRKHECVCQDEVLVCAVPIFVNKQWWGFIGFDYINGTRVWKDEDETLLRIAADILGGNMYHRTRYWTAVDIAEDAHAHLGECVEILEGCGDRGYGASRG